MGLIDRNGDGKIDAGEAFRASVLASAALSFFQLRHGDSGTPGGGPGDGSGCSGCLVKVLGALVGIIVVVAIVSTCSSGAGRGSAATTSAATVARTYRVPTTTSTGAASTAATTADGAATPSTEGAPTAETPAPTSAPTPAAPDPATATNPDGRPIAESMPYKGMPAAFIDATWLGPHDGEGEVIDGGQKQGATPYYWLARNGTGDRVFTAYVRGSEVIGVNKDTPWANYWAQPDSIMSRDFPDLTASGERVEKQSLSPRLEDPSDYDSPEEYADNAEGYFRDKGSSDPWGDAYRYWEKNAL